MKSNILRQWLNDRGITDEVIALFNIQSTDHPSIGECIEIPITPTWSKYRRHPLDDRKPKYLYDKGGKVTLYGADKLLGPKDVQETVERIAAKTGSDPDLLKRVNMMGVIEKILITEGELDTLVAWSQNIPAVSSTGGALSFQEDWAIDLAPYQVYVCFDNDEAGAEGMVKVLKHIPDAKIVFVPTMPDVKDISDYVSKGGDLRDLLATAKSFKTIEEVEEDKKHRKANWQSTTFHNKYIAKHREQAQRTTEPNPYTGSDPVLKAKEYPMGNLINFERHKACCPWHNEKTPSLHYYPKTNSAYCFGGCGRSYDSIDAYMLTHGVGFLQAVKELNK